MKRMRLYLVAIAAMIVGVVGAKLWQDRHAAPTPVVTRKTPTAEEVGSTAAGLSKGFLEGVNDRLKEK